MVYESKIDLRVRRKALEKLKEKFGQIIKDILSGKPPVLEIRKRTLSNTIYDPQRKLLLLGNEVLHRSFLDAGEAKKFMQTVLMASIIYEALKNNEYPTIRDLYYRGKHTIRYRMITSGRIYEENTWDEQQESDSVIRDIEVFIDMLREDMLILSKEKGKVVGNMRIRSGDDIIDLSKMGHGAYAIEPTPDLIEFIDVDAEFVLVIEKDAVFQQLHRAGFWRKYRAILVTSAGQPDRATRRFIRRLNEELKLPIYILTDSIPADEVVIIRDTESNMVRIGPIETLIGKYFSSKDKERVFINAEVPSWNPETGKIEWRKVGYAYRHKIKDKILRIVTKGRGEIRVTKAHSLFVFRDGTVKVIPAKEIRPGDYIVIASRLPSLNSSGEHQIIDVVKLLKKYSRSKYSKRFNLWNTARVITRDGRVIKLREVREDTNYDNGYVTLSRSKHLIPAKIELDEELAWLFGIFTAEGSLSKGRYVIFNLGSHEHKLIRKIIEIITKKFNVKPKLISSRKANQIRIVICSRILYMVFDSLGLGGTARSKSIPEIIINSPRNIILSYIKGLIDGNGHIDRYGDIIYSTRSELLSKQLFNVLLSLGVLPAYTENGEDNIIRIGKSISRTPPEIYMFLTSEESSINESYSYMKNIAEIAAEPTYGIPINDKLKGLLIKYMNKGSISYSSKNKTISKQKMLKLHSLTRLLPDDYEIIAFGDVALVKVLKVSEEDYDGYVYDFAVPVTNSFVGSYGVVYHNSDPYGWYIYSVFKVGSINLSYESLRLATPEAKFLGVSMTDVFGHKGLGKRPYLSEAERRNFIIKATERDIKRAKELMNYTWFKMPRWKIEIDIFLSKKAKLEIEALTSKGLRFLMDKYLPEKIQTGDWID